MKRWVFFLTAMMMTLDVSARTTAVKKADAQAIQQLINISVATEAHKVSGQADALKMLAELATGWMGIDEDYFYKYEYEAKADQAWEPDGSAWALISSQDARSFFAYHESIDEEQNQQLKKTKLKQIEAAISVLEKDPSLHFGLAPMGAVQCGVRFPALLIMDSETGEVMSFDMDESGC